MTTIIPKINAFKGDSIQIELNFKRTDITGYSIRATLYDSNEYAYQKLGLSIDSTTSTSSLAQDYTFKVNETEYTITTTASMSYAQITSLMNVSLGSDFTCIIVGTEDDQDIKIIQNNRGSEYSVLITAGSVNDLLTLLNSTPSASKAGIPHVIKKGSAIVTGGSSDQINFIDTRAGYQDFGLSIDSSSASNAAAQDYDITVNDTLYTITLTASEIYSSIVSKLNTELGTTYTCSIIGNSPTQDIRIEHNTEGDDNDVEIEAGSSADLLTLLSSTPEIAVSGFTNKGWYNVEIDEDETIDFVGDSYIEIEVEDSNGKKFSSKGCIVFETPYISWSAVS